MDTLAVIDYKNDATYKAATTPAVLTVPTMQFIMVDGAGAPEAGESEQTEFQEAMAILFGIVYTIKFWDKKFTPPTGYSKFTLAPIEGLWWMEDGSLFDVKRTGEWRWTVMLRVPEFVTPSFFEQVVETVCSQKKSDIYRRARLASFSEGECVQIMHIGPYSSEGPTIERLHQYAQEQGYILTGKHHELYFGDPRRTKPENLKTILRQPVTNAT